jgi:diguanylate cyclase (GGDEF)-like protein/PAS domain S-box-containing protein
VPIGLLVFWAMGRLHLLGDVPYWVLVLLLVLGSILNASTFALTRRIESRSARIQVRLAVSTVTTTAVVYATGWGSLLTIGYAVGVADVLRSEGSRAWKPGLVWSAAGILAGELLITVNAVPILIEPRISHAVAIAGVACIGVVVYILGFTAESAERLADELAEREEQFRSMVQHAADVIGVIDGEGIISYVSPAVGSLLGLDPEDCAGRSVLQLLAPGERNRIKELATVLDRSPDASASAEVRLQHRDGSPRLTRVTATRRGDGLVVLNVHDITAQRALEDRLTYQARHDALTGLLNRSALMEELEHARDEAAVNRAPLAVLFVDLDGFKTVNDELGHEQGDRLLVEAAQRIASCLGHTDRVGRLGGDEFLVVLCAIRDERDAQAVAWKILDVLAEPWHAGEAPVLITASIGVATVADRDVSTDEVVRRADGAMYEAKRRGRRRAVVA